MRSLVPPAVVLLVSLNLALSFAYSQEVEEATNFSEFSGNVVDTGGKPIKEFSVALQVYDYSEGGWSVAPKVVKKWNGEFENGEFRFDVESPIPINDKTYLSRTVTAKGFLETNSQNTLVPLRTFKGTFAKTELSRGIKIKGKVVLPDNQANEELIAPRLIFMRKVNSIMPDLNNLFQNYCKVETDGSFEATVPENCTLLVTASANNAATFHQQFTIAKSKSADDERDLGELKLKEGVSITGVVLNKQGQPVEGQIIRIQRKASQVSYMQDIVNGYATSDGDGKFKLPPREGKCTISLVKQANIDNKLAKVKGKLLMTKPIDLVLKVGEPTDIKVQESNTWKIHGIVNFNDRETLSALTGSAGGSQTTVEIDENGQFEVDVVEDTEPYLIIHQSVGTQFYMARMSTASLKRFRKHFSGSPEDNGQYFQFKKVTSDIGPLTFDMVEHVPDSKTFSEWLFDWWVYGDD